MTVLVRTIRRHVRPPYRWTIAARIIAGVVLAIPSTFPHTADAEPWRIETVSATPGSWTAIAVTPDGIPRIAYATGAGVKSDEYPWGSPSTVSSDNPDLISMDLATDGMPSYVWVNRNPAPIDDYIRVVPGAGLFTGQCTSQPSLRVDSNGVMHLVYTRDAGCDNRADLAYYTRTVSGDWNEHSTVISTMVYDYTGRVLAMDLGLNDEPGIAHFSGLPGHLRLRYNDNPSSGGGLMVFDSNHDVEHIALAIDDGNGQPHIVFNDATAGEFLYATRTGGNWTTDIISRTDGDRWWYGSIVVDSDGTPHVAFFNQETGTVRFARPSGSFWVQQTLETVGASGGYTSIAIDEYDGIHVSYYDATNARIRYASSLDCNDNNIHDLDEIDAELTEDCNDNGHPDECDIALGFAEDCNGNGVPDACDTDCNNNNIPDDCDIASGASTDCNSNGIPDECEPDCNNNDIPDQCDITSGYSLDCNGNGIPDDCDFANGTSTDCNGNGIPDDCDVYSGGYPDCDRNGLPDECDFAAGGVADCDANLDMDLCELPDPVILSDTASGWFGLAVVSADFNGDGYSDVAVGQPYWSGERGRVFIFYGGDPMDTVADVVKESNTVNANYGFSLAAGNINGDAYDDLIIGAPGYNIEDGVAFVFRGTAGTSMQYMAAKGAPFPDQRFATSLALADINGDGLEDMIVGAPEHDTSGLPSYAYAYSATSIDGDPIETWVGANNDDGFGGKVANAGDIDNNGLDDVIVGALGGASTGNVGYASLFLSQLVGGSTVGPVLSTGVADDEFAASVAGVRDVNDDGIDDFLVGAPRSGVPGDLPGRSYLYFGNETVDGVADLTFVGADHLANHGVAVSGGGDLNGDGFDDIVIGSDHLYDGGDFSWADIFFGGPFLDIVPDKRFKGSIQGYGTGMTVGPAGDTNNDGVNEVLIADPPYSNGGILGKVSIVRIPLPDYGDCNSNGTPDMCDISSGFSTDVDGNGVPDECGYVSAVGEIETPSRTRLLGAHPNPFNPQTTIVFELSRQTVVGLRIFDLSGRLVRVLADGEVYAQGRSEATWNGRDDDGRQVAAGVYFYRLDAGDFSETKRMALVK